MNLQNSEQIGEVLRSNAINIHELYEIWDRRVPISDPLHEKRGKYEATRHEGVRWFQDRATLLPEFTAKAMAAGEYLLACDIAREALWIETEFHPEQHHNLQRMRLDYARALARLGDLDEALAQLSPFNDSTVPAGLRSAGFELRGSLIWESARQHKDRASQIQLLTEAYHSYKMAVSLDPSNINGRTGLAVITHLLGVAHECASIAKDTLRLIDSRENEFGRCFISMLARANTLALLGRLEEAAEAYSQLAAFPDATTGKLADARYESGLLAKAIGERIEYFHHAFPPLQLLIFAGHLPDGSPTQNRFTRSHAPIVREEIRSMLEFLGARIGLSSAAAGGDLLFLDELHRRNASSLVVLPWSRHEFLKTSVRPFDGNVANTESWEALFERSLEVATSVCELGQLYQPEGETSLSYTTEVSAGIALLAAKAARVDVQPIALWDGQSGGKGGTADFVSFWKHRMGKEPVIISPFSKSIKNGGIDALAPIQPMERRTLRQEVKTMLFADIVGYSKLPEGVIPEFVEHFLGQVSQIASCGAYRPSSIKTWGDAICAVFDYAVDAGNFALQVIKMVRDREAEWFHLGLCWKTKEEDGQRTIPLNIRIGLL